MSIQKIEKQLKKIDNLVQSIKDAEEYNIIEKDLLLSYTRKLYQRILEWEDSEKDTSTTPPSHDFTPRETYVKPESLPVKEVVRAPEVVDMASVAREEMRMDNSEDIQETIVAATPEQVEEKKELTYVESTVEEKNDIPEDMQDIFSGTVIADLSDKYGNAPIQDLTKSMGINEKIFTVQELFGGNQELFNTTLSRLNGFENFDEAKVYLANGVARDQEWNADNKIKKATNFVKLVQRRYA